MSRSHEPADISPELLSQQAVVEAHQAQQLQLSQLECPW